MSGRNGGPSRPAAVPSGRALRATRLGAMAAGVAGNMAAGALRDLAGGSRPRARDLVLTPANIRRIANELARMRGAAMKIGQLVSMETGDMLPPELAEILARLRAEADFMPPRQLDRVLIGQWGPDWRQRFHRFDVRPIAAASIGQVHRATLKDGRDLAIKVQYPGIRRSIDSDVSNVGALMRLSGLLPKGFDLAPYLDEARRQLKEEADYGQESRYLLAFRDLLEGDARFALPALVAELTTTDILAMSYMPGHALEAAVDQPQPVRDRIMGDLMELVVRELFAFGLMQTDPNFANYRYDPETGRIVLLDFGASRYFSAEVVETYRGILRAGFDGDRTGLEAALGGIGVWDAGTDPAHRAQILDMAEIVFAALRSDALFDFGTTDLLARLNHAGEALARSGYVPPAVPMDALYLQRKFAGTFLLAARLKARVPVRAVLAPAVYGAGTGSGAEAGRRA